MEDEIKGKEFMIIRIAVQVKEGKVAYNCNNDRRKGQKDKREGIPMHDEWPAKEAERFDLYGNLTKSKEI